MPVTPVDSIFAMIVSGG